SGRARPHPPGRGESAACPCSCPWWRPHRPSPSSICDRSVLPYRPPVCPLGQRRGNKNHAIQCCPVQPYAARSTGLGQGIQSLIRWIVGRCNRLPPGQKWLVAVGHRDLVKATVTGPAPLVDGLAAARIDAGADDAEADAKADAMV